MACKSCQKPSPCSLCQTCKVQGPCVGVQKHGGGPGIRICVKYNCRNILDGDSVLTRTIGQVSELEDMQAEGLCLVKWPARVPTGSVFESRG